MKISLLVLFLPALLFSSKSIVVPLRTALTLIPIRVNETKREGGTYSSDYLKKLKSILHFDLSQNGATAIVKQSREGYTLSLSLSGSILKGSLHSSKSGKIYPLDQVELSGNFASDRRAIHLLSDQIHEKITGRPGIASSQILYAVSIPHTLGGKTVWKSEIYSVDYDGGNPVKLTKEESYCITPQYFTRNKFIYVNYKQGQPKLYEATFGAKTGKPFVSLRGNQLLPSFSRDGRLLAFISDASGRADLFIQHLDPNSGPVGKPIQAYSFPRSVQASPTFRPDGRKIAFVSDKEGTPRVYIIDTPQRQPKKRAHALCLTKLYRENTCPNWSPDGTKLAYSAKIDGTRQIMIYDFMTREEIQITHCKRHKENPCFAPDSLHLVFNTVDSSSELFLINIKQREMIQITNGPGKKHYPAWDPKYR